MYDTSTILVIFGSILLVLAILGGGVSVKEIKVPPIKSRVRNFLYPLSIAFIVAGVWLSRLPPPASVVPTIQPTTTSQIGAILPSPSLETATQINDPFDCKVLSDDFSQKSGWGDEEVDWGGWGHENGEYRMSLYKPNFLSLHCKWCNDLYQQDFRVSVTARTPQFNGSWGIYFWGKEKFRHSFELDKDGNALIKQYDDYDYTVLGSQHIVARATNVLTVEYLNGIINGYINGEPVVTVPAESPPVLGNFGVGLIQASQSSNSAEVFFDDFSFSGCP